MGNLGDNLNTFLDRQYAGLFTGGVVCILVLAPTLIQYVSGEHPAGGEWLLTLALATTLGAFAYTGISRLQRARLALKDLQRRLEKTEVQLEASQRRQNGILQISQLFAEAQDEGEVITLVLRQCQELLAAEAASFVPLDERAQPLASTTLGKMPFPAPEAWVEYLASPAVRQKCGECQNLDELVLECPLLRGSFMDTMGIYCLPIRRGEQEYGILNLYLPRTESVDSDSQALLRTLVNETSLALEGIRLRKRALTTLRQMQAVRLSSDLRQTLEDLLASLHETLDADYALLSTWYGGEGQGSDTITWGEAPEEARPTIDRIIRSVAAAEEPIILGNASGEGSSSPGVRGLMAVPLLIQDKAAFGVLLVANQRVKAFNQRQLLILQTIAGQAALLLQNASLIAQIEYKATVQERTRLAREIHDGLAQTLGYLKLKTAQMRGYIEQAEMNLVEETLVTVYQVLDDAYQEARQSIDGLRIASANESFPQLLQQTAAEFEELSGVTVELCPSTSRYDFPPEVNTQLIRIVQEALSNVRKHAQAKRVEISCREAAGFLILEIVDDGAGFLAEDVHNPYRHGLRGMQERAELIGADYQITSRPQMGTTVSIRMPFDKKETNYETDPPGRGR
ncbi:MAG TPA: GAF domain-containing protein [Anaerolineales bacterium]|nr:GAF domain-containing protein [Anaerolineales bacterium]